MIYYLSIFYIQFLYVAHAPVANQILFFMKQLSRKIMKTVFQTDTIWLLLDYINHWYNHNFMIRVYVQYLLLAQIHVKV